MPYFSVIIPSFNRAHTIVRTINGILEQNFNDFELLIVDDGSSDSTKETIEVFLNDSRIKYFYQNNAGVCAARNNGAKNATGDYLIFLDSDDFVEKDWLKDFYDINNKKNDILFCSMKLIKADHSIKLTSCLNPYEDGKSKGITTAGSWAIKKEVFFEAGMYDEKIKFGENTELRFRLDERNLKMGMVDKYNFIYYESIDGGSKNLKNKIDANLYIILKHPNYFKKNPHVLRFYYQNIAVAFGKLSEWSNARQYFWKAYKVEPWQLKTLIRLILSLFPFRITKIYK